MCSKIVEFERYCAIAALNEVTQPGGLLKGLKIMLMGFHLLLQVCNGKPSYNMLQEFEVHKVAVVCESHPEVIKCYFFVHFHEMVMNELLMLMFSRYIK